MPIIDSFNVLLKNGIFSIYPLICGHFMELYTVSDSFGRYTDIFPLVWLEYFLHISLTQNLQMCVCSWQGSLFWVYGVQMKIATQPNKAAPHPHI